MKLNQTEELKKEAGILAASFVKSNTVIGLGTGSTTKYAIEEIARLLKEEKLKNIVGVSTSLQTEALAQSLNIPLTDFSNITSIALTIDGADEVSPSLDMIKGGGGALLREKVVARVSEETIYIVDENKLSLRLGMQWKIPVEVVPFAYPLIQKQILSNFGFESYLRTKPDGSPVFTDQGNCLLDVKSGEIDDVAGLEKQLNEITGVVENGLFIKLAQKLIVGTSTGVVTCLPRNKLIKSEDSAAKPIESFSLIQ